MKKDEFLNYIFIFFIILSSIIVFPNKSDIFELPRFYIFTFFIFLYLFLKPDKNLILPQKFEIIHILFIYLILYGIIFYIFKPSLLIFSNIIFLLSLYISINIFYSLDEKISNFSVFLISLFGFFEAIYGIFQYFNLDPIFEMTLSTSDKRMKMAGTIGIPAIFGIFLGISILAQIYILLKKKSKFFIFLIPLTSISFFLNNTRSAIFGLFFGILFLIKKIQLKILIVLSFFMLFFIFLFIKNDFKNRWNEIFELKKTHSGTIRLFYWDITFKAIKENPIFGYGPLSFSRTYFEKQSKLIEEKKVNLPEVIQPLLNAHNDYLQIWLEYGIFGLFLYLSVLLKGIFWENNSLKKSILIFIGFTSFFLFPLFYPSTLILVVLILSLRF